MACAPGRGCARRRHARGAAAARRSETFAPGRRGPLRSISHRKFRGNRSHRHQSRCTARGELCSERNRRRGARRYRALRAGDCESLMRREDAQRIPALWVLELSSFQLETTYTLAAHAATVLNLSEDHLDRYPNMDEYARAKSRIFQGSGIQVLNRDDPRSRAMALPGRTTVTFGLGAP